eukprot:1848442-Pleurochrysis_carterae.AAC.1
MVYASMRACLVSLRLTVVVCMLALNECESEGKRTTADSVLDGAPPLTRGGRRLARQPCGPLFCGPIAQMCARTR